MPRQKDRRGIEGVFSKKPYMISVNPHMPSKESTDQIVGKQVTQMATVEERAKAETKEAIKAIFLTYQKRL